MAGENLLQTSPGEEVGMATANAARRVRKAVQHHDLPTTGAGAEIPNLGRYALSRAMAGPQAMSDVAHGRLDPLSPEGIMAAHGAAMNVLGQSPFAMRGSLGAGGGKMSIEQEMAAFKAAMGSLSNFTKSATKPAVSLSPGAKAFEGGAKPVSSDLTKVHFEAGPLLGGPPAIKLQKFGTEYDIAHPNTGAVITQGHQSPEEALQFWQKYHNVNMYKNAYKNEDLKAAGAPPPVDIEAEMAKLLAQKPKLQGPAGTGTPYHTPSWQKPGVPKSPPAGGTSPDWFDSAISTKGSGIAPELENAKAQSAFQQAGALPASIENLGENGWAVKHPNGTVITLGHDSPETAVQDWIANQKSYKIPYHKATGVTTATSAPPPRENPLSAEEIAARRAASPYQTQVYRGLTQPPKGEGPWANAHSGHGETYTAANPQVAGLYAHVPVEHELNPSLRSEWGAPEGSNVVPLMLDTSKYHAVDAGGKTWGGTKAEGGGGSIIMWNAINHARDNGLPGVIVRNIFDEPAGNTRELGKPTDVYIPLDRSTARLPWAEFDPAKFHMKDLLASGVGLAVPAGLAGQLLRDGDGNHRFLQDVGKEEAESALMYSPGLDHSAHAAWRAPNAAQ